MQERDLDLIKRWQSADEHATHVLFNQHYPRLVHLAMLSGLAQDEAQDCAQEAFVRAFVRRRQLRDPAAFPLWFHRLFMHHLLDVLKARQRRGQVPLERIEEDACLSTQPENVALAAEWQASLWQQVQALPATYRIPLILRYYEEYSLREIAHLLGKREGTMRVILHRALQCLRLQAEEQKKQNRRFSGPSMMVSPASTCSKGE